MIRISFFTAAIVLLMSFCLGSSAHAAAPEEQLIEAVKVALGKNFNTDWGGLDALPGIQAESAVSDLPNSGRVPCCGGNSILRYASLKYFFHNGLITNDLNSAKA
jgi:hypothetical protein